jgi:anti-anti-sigma regulatory factor
MSMLERTRDSDHHSGDHATVVVHGKQDRAAAIRLRAQLGELLDTGLHELVLDLSEVPRRNPETNRTLAWLRDRLRLQGGHLTILAGAQTPTAALDDPHEAALTEGTANLAAHCDQPGSPDYRPETADQP